MKAGTVRQAIFASVKDRNTTINAHVHAFARVADGYFAVVLSSGGKTFDEVNAAFERVVNNGLSLVPGTLYKRPDSHLTAIAAVNVESRPYTAESVKDMKLITANVFADKDDFMWTVVGEGENKRLVQTSEQDFEALLTAAKSRRHSSVVAFVETELDVRPSDFTMFFNPASGEVDSGFAVTLEDGTFAVLSFTSGIAVPVNKQCILIAAQDERFAKQPVTAMSDGAQAYIDYLRSLYGEDNDYIRAFVDALKKHAV